MPPAAAQQLSARPGTSFLVTIVFGLLVTWLGLGAAYFSVYPVGFFVTTFGFIAYVARRRGAPFPSVATHASRWAGVMVLLVDPLTGLSHMLSHPFMRDALLAGTAIALVSGLIGYFVVLRSQVFAADALSHVAFAGALGALAFGIDLRAGLYGACILFASCSRSSAAVLPPTTR